jgi:nicotinamide-nucleotide amidase
MNNTDLLVQLAQTLQSQRHMLTTAESCTGGLIAAACTELAGSSGWFERGFITYSNASKTDLLGVSSVLIDAHGAVSEAVAGAMAQGALQRSRAHWAVSVTGIAGPGGGSTHKPVGMVCFGFARQGLVQTSTEFFTGHRAAIRVAALRCALLGVIHRCASARFTGEP